jgi:DNA-binding CsgD family transcriptional regulator
MSSKTSNHGRYHRQTGLYMNLLPSEFRILGHMCKGETAEETATKFGVSLATVRTQRAAVFAKLGAKSASHAVGIVMKDMLRLATGEEAYDLADLHQLASSGRLSPLVERYRMPGGRREDSGAPLVV